MYKSYGRIVLISIEGLIMKILFKSTLVATAVVAMVAIGCSSSDGGNTTVGPSIPESLQIVSAVYDDNGTVGDLADDRLFVYFDKQVDDGSASSSPFDLTGGAIIDGSLFNYTEGLPYKLIVSDALVNFEGNEINISVAAGGFTVGGKDVLAGDAVAVTALQVVVPSSDRSFTLNELDKALNDVNKYEQFVYEQLDVIREKIIGTEGRNFEKRTRQLFVLHVKRSGMIKAIGINSNYIFVIVQKLNSVTAFVLLAPKNYMVI